MLYLINILRCGSIAIILGLKILLYFVLLVNIQSQSFLDFLLSFHFIVIFIIWNILLIKIRGCLLVFHLTGTITHILLIRIYFLCWSRFWYLLKFCRRSSLRKYPSLCMLKFIRRNIIISIYWLLSRMLK